MSIIDKVVDAVTPPESEEARLKARAKARVSAGKDDWLAMVLESSRASRVGLCGGKGRCRSRLANSNLEDARDPVDRSFHR